METITYNKKDLVKRLSYKLNMHYEESKITLDCVLNIFENLFLENNDRTRIELRNFGIFDIKMTKKRTNARNPKTNKSVIIPARKKISFKPSKKIRQALYKETKSFG